VDNLKSLEHRLKTIFFQVFKSLLRKGRADLTPLDGQSLRKVLFLRPEKIGDMVVSFPLFDELLRHYPRMRISILASPRNCEIIRGDPRFARVFLYQKRLFRDLLEILAIRRERYDCIVDMIDDDSVTGLVLSQITAVGCPRVRYAPPYIEQDERDRADEYFTSSMSSDTDGLRIGYNLSAGKSTRLWPKEKSRQLITSILGCYPGSRVVLITTPSDRARGDELEQLFEERVIQVPPRLSIRKVSAIISRLDLLVTPDTSLVHIARSFKVPVVGMYPQLQWNLERWRPYGQKGGVVISNDDGHIFDITPVQVLAEVTKILARQGVSQS